MRAFRKLCIAVLAIFLILAAVLNIVLIRQEKAADGMYRVEAKRLADEIAETGSYDLEIYPHITGVFTADDGGLYTSDEHYLITKISGTLYRVEYSTDSNQHGMLIINLVLCAVFLMMVALLLYIYRHIIAPFDRLNEVPQELARGNLAVPIPEEKSRSLRSS